jgi:NADH-quinone oxidoreductase subunit A
LLDSEFVPSTLRRGFFFALLRDFFHEVVDFRRSNPVFFAIQDKTPLPAFELSSYYPIFIYFIVVLGFAVTAIVLTQLIGPQNKTRVKLMTYESGMDPIGDARQHFDVKFYLIAILFLVFDVELLFLYPWAVIAYRQEQPSLPVELRGVVFWEVLVFLATLVLAYVYAWRKGVFRWR